MTKPTAAILLALSLSACSTLGIGSSPQTLSDAEKGLTLAHYSYDGLGYALKGAATSGLLKGADAASAKVIYDKAGDTLKLGDDAVATASATTVADTVAKVNALILDANLYTKAH